MNLTPAAVSTLEALATYYYLTPSLVELTGIATKRTARDKVFPQLLKARPSTSLVECKRFRKTEGKEHLYALSRRGVKYLNEISGIPTDDIFFPKKGIQISNHYDHCTAFVAFHIQFMKWLNEVEGRLIKFDRYFGRVPHPEAHRKELICATTIFHRDGQISPDGMVKFETNGNEKLFAIEIHHDNKSGRIIDQLEKHVISANDGAPQARYQHSKRPHVLNIFDEPNVMENVKARFYSSSVLQDQKQGFLFNTLKQIKADISKGWQYANGQIEPFVFANRQ